MARESQSQPAAQYYYTRVEIAARLDIDAEFLISLEREAVISPDAPPSVAGEFSALMLERVRVAHNLVHDLEVNLPGACIIVKMRERLLGQRRSLEHALMELDRERKAR